MGQWGISGGRPAYPWYPCLFSEKCCRGQDQGPAQESFIAFIALQGRVRQAGGSVEEGITDSDEEEEGGDVMPKVARTIKRRPRVTTKPQASPTPVDPNASSLIIPSPLNLYQGMRIVMGGDVYNTDSLTSHTTASNSTSADILSVEASSSVPPSVTESKFSTIMPYLEESLQSDHASDSVFTDTEASIELHSSPSQHITESPIPKDSTVLSSPPESPAPKRSARNTWGACPVHFGKVIVHSTIVSEMAKTPTYGQTLFVSCMPNIILQICTYLSHTL